jgi:hypothetical protein
MTDTQLKNLINFCFNFSRDMNMPLLGSDATYILEKWEKYIGMTPIKNDALCISELLKTQKLFTEHKIKRDATYDKIEVLILWHHRWKDEYDEVKEILYFLLVINSNEYPKWTPRRLRDEFIKMLGDPEKINDYPYNFLHDLVKQQIQNWLNIPLINRDYNLCLLID